MGGQFGKWNLNVLLVLVICTQPSTKAFLTVAGQRLGSPGNQPQKRDQTYLLQKGAHSLPWNLAFSLHKTDSLNSQIPLLQNQRAGKKNSKKLSWYYSPHFTWSITENQNEKESQRPARATRLFNEWRQYAEESEVLYQASWWQGQDKITVPTVKIFPFFQWEE